MTQSLSWTSEKPTQPGWYWVRNLRVPLLRGKYREVERFGVVEVLRDQTGSELYVSVTGSDWMSEIVKVEGEWAGPLEPPS
ncbi:MAG TPA: hypothetical protein VJ746_05400 [Nitrospira sp.]|nr:hypothetical protein [Nitrospira sp.]